jgi:hypothetical protein
MGRSRARARPAGVLTLRDLPYQVLGASDFTRDRRLAVHSTIHYLALFAAEPAVSRSFLEQTDFNHPDGRPRMDAHWGLAYLAFTASPHGAMLPFWRDLCGNEALLEACGFRQPDGRLWRPSYQTLCARFAELEASPHVFQDAAGLLVRYARTFEPAIGAHVAFDGTEAATHARGRHDCDDAECPDRGRGRLVKLDTQRAKEMRQRQAEIDEEPGIAPQVTVRGLRAGEVTGVHKDPERGGVRWFSGGHWWWCADEDVGPRAYTDEHGKLSRFWIGDLPVQALDLCTGGMVGVITRPASTNEHTGFAELCDQVTEISGIQPLSIGVDKGFYYKETYLEAARRGILMVGPHRASPGAAPGEGAPATTRWDTHGDPLCAHCGGRTRRIGSLTTSGGRPRITFACLLPQGPDCQARQTIECANEPRRLIAVSRRSAVYRALSRARNQLERGHNLMRRRYNIAASDLRERPRRLGAGARHLRALSGMVVDWLRICIRHGWLGSGPPLGAPRQPFPVPELKEPAPATRRKKRRARSKARGAAPPAPA